MSVLSRTITEDQSTIERSCAWIADCAAMDSHCSVYGTWYSWCITVQCPRYMECAIVQSNNQNTLVALIELTQLIDNLRPQLDRANQLVSIVTSGVALNTIDTSVIKQLGEIRTAIGS